MKLLFLTIFFCCCYSYSNAQLSLSDTISDQWAFNSTTNKEQFSGYYPNGNKKYEGKKLKEQLHGQWTSWWSNGKKLDSGLLVKGMPDGAWIMHYMDGTPRFIRTYSFDKWQQFQNEKTSYHPKRVSMPLTELYHKNKTQARKYTKAGYTFCAIQNCNRYKAGMQQTVDQNISEQHYHPVFQNGLLHGAFANYFPDGSVKDSGNYKNGLPEGLWIKWTDDKQYYWNGFYHHGLKNKEWKLYASNGKLVRIVSYREGKYLWRKDMKEGIETTTEEITGF